MSATVTTGLEDSTWPVALLNRRTRTWASAQGTSASASPPQKKRGKKKGGVEAGNNFKINIDIEHSVCIDTPPSPYGISIIGEQQQVSGYRSLPRAPLLSVMGVRLRCPGGHLRCATPLRCAASRAGGGLALGYVDDREGAGRFTTALPPHCHRTITALPQHCHSTATALPQQVLR